MSYDVGDDTGNADIGHPGYHVLWEETVGSHLAKHRQLQEQQEPWSRGPATPPGWGRMASSSSFNRQHHPDASRKSAGSEYWTTGLGAADGWSLGSCCITIAKTMSFWSFCLVPRVRSVRPRPHHHLQGQGGGQHTAGDEADREAQEEQGSPPQELHHEHLQGKERGRVGRLRGPAPHGQAGGPGVPATPLPGAAVHCSWGGGLWGVPCPVCMPLDGHHAAQPGPLLLSRCGPGTGTGPKCKMLKQSHLTWGGFRSGDGVSISEGHRL